MVNKVLSLNVVLICSAPFSPFWGCFFALRIEISFFFVLNRIFYACLLTLRIWILPLRSLLLLSFFTVVHSTRGLLSTILEPLGVLLCFNENADPWTLSEIYMVWKKKHADRIRNLSNIYATRDHQFVGLKRAYEQPKGKRMYAHLWRRKKLLFLARNIGIDGTTASISLSLSLPSKIQTEHKILTPHWFKE